jgi:DtxR family transcriptional regulator, Mn-dependent transcriptional regulator
VETTAAVEDYLKAVWQLETTGGVATTTALAGRLGVSAPSVSAMVKRLVEGGLLERSTDRGLALSDTGRSEALRVVRRHRLLETFLEEVVGLPWDEVHAEAEVLEHVLSPRLEERIDALLGHPARDPHGDPIPPAGGTRHDEAWATPLSGVPVASRFRVERVSDRDSGALRYLAGLGIRVGTEVVVGERIPYGGPLWLGVVDPGTGSTTERALGEPLVDLIFGSVLEGPPT